MEQNVERPSPAVKEDGGSRVNFRGRGADLRDCDPESLVLRAELVSADLSSCDLQTSEVEWWWAATNKEEKEPRPALEELDLSSNQLTAVPTLVFQLPSLRRLDLSLNPLSADCFLYPKVPLDFGKTFNRRLTRLALRSCGLTHFPTCLYKLRDLHSLDLSGNQLAGGRLSEGIGALMRLRHLRLAHTGVMDLSGSLGELENLTTLDLGGNSLDTFPECLLSLWRLRVLDLSGNRLGYLPVDLSPMQSLVQLSVAHNRVDNLPDRCGANLRVLDAYDNLITSLPSSKGYLSRLTALDLGQNCDLNESFLPSDYAEKEAALRELLLDAKSKETRRRTEGSLTDQAQSRESDDTSEEEEDQEVEPAPEDDQEGATGEEVEQEEEAWPESLQDRQGSWWCSAEEGEDGDDSGLAGSDDESSTPIRPAHVRHQFSFVPSDCHPARLSTAAQYEAILAGRRELDEDSTLVPDCALDRFEDAE